jgi:hypothetical protein
MCNVYPDCAESYAQKEGPMQKVLDDLICQLFHGRWAEPQSYSRQGRWRCTKPDCAAQAHHERELVDSGIRVSVDAPARVAHRSGHMHGRAA